MPDVSLSTRVSMLIRDAVDDDLPQILAIHNRAVAETTAIWSYHPADLANRKALLEDRRARGYPFLVAAEGDTVTGYASFGDFRPHDGYHRTVEHSVYVHRDHHRKGIARRLMLPLMQRAAAIGKHVMIGGLDADNEASLRLHASLGFVETARLPEVGFKFDRYLTLVFVQKVLDSA